ncbi:MAG: DUF2812 domain-containing protein [Clostridia bacterium]|nr:DUF2812 domain-containing protein [Clostridia bacterium]
MKKRFLHPIWKFDEIEKELSVLEQNGWRLNKIYGIRNFEFVKSKPKSVKYFFTYSIPREKINMYIIEDTLKQKFNATEIRGNFGGTQIYRITKQGEVEEQIFNRNIILQHYLFKRMICCLLLLLLFSIPLIMGLILNPEKLLNDIISQFFESVLLAFCFMLVVFGLIYNIIGYVYMKSKNK